jgi:TonB family protein
MFNRLLESKANRDRSIGGTVASAVAHTGLIGLAIYGTAHAHVDATPPTQLVRPVYFAPPRGPTLSQSVPGNPLGVVRQRLVFVNPTVSIAVPSVDMPPTTFGAADFHGELIGGSASFGPESKVSAGVDATFRADQVEKQVSLIPGSASPTYPEALRLAGREGRVIAQFVVDEKGCVEEKTVKLVRSDDVRFDEAVRSVLPRMRFAPAEIAGRKVRQLVEMPFVFALSR